MRFIFLNSCPYALIWNCIVLGPNNKMPHQQEQHQLRRFYLTLWCILRKNMLLLVKRLLYPLLDPPSIQTMPIPLVQTELSFIMPTWIDNVSRWKQRQKIYLRVGIGYWLSFGIITLWLLFNWSCMCALNPLKCLEWFKP